MFLIRDNELLVLETPGLPRLFISEKKKKEERKCGAKTGLGRQFQGPATFGQGKPELTGKIRGKIGGDRQRKNLKRSTRPSNAQIYKDTSCLTC